MKKLILILFCMFTAGQSYGHASHSHEPVTKEKAIKIAKKEIQKLVFKEDLEKSWETAEFIEIKTMTYGKKKELRLVFENKQAKNIKKSKLYVFLSLFGKYLAANHTGK